MYYYVFEPPLEAKEYEKTTQIKDYLAKIGIAGEMVTPSPSRTVEDLIELAVAKRYSTIVAVGGTELINRVARCLEPYDVVFGIIPLKELPDISKLIGVSDWKSAADQLKRRRWLPVRLGLLNKELCFITPATIALPPEVQYFITGPDYTVHGIGGTLTLSPLRGGSLDESSLLLEINNAPQKRGLLFGLFSSSPETPGASSFDLKNFSLETSEPVPVSVAGTPLCSTPLFCEPQQTAIKLIVGKADTP